MTVRLLLLRTNMGSSENRNHALMQQSNVLQSAAVGVGGAKPVESLDKNAPQFDNRISRLQYGSLVTLPFSSLSSFLFVRLPGRPSRSATLIVKWLIVP